MTDPRIDKQRAELKSLLGAIVDSYRAVDRVLSDEKHPRGVAHRSLEPHSGTFVVHDERGIDCRYIHSDGKIYEINIARRG